MDIDSRARGKLIRLDSRKSEISPWLRLPRLIIIRKKKKKGTSSPPRTLCQGATTRDHLWLAHGDYFSCACTYSSLCSSRGRRNRGSGTLFEIRRASRSVIRISSRAFAVETRETIVLSREIGPESFAPMESHWFSILDVSRALAKHFDSARVIDLNDLTFWFQINFANGLFQASGEFRKLF